MKQPLALRALELHGHRMWERGAVVRTLEFMQRHALNALVLHESDLVHQLVYPRKYFDPYALWSDLPSRRGENAIFNRRAYFDHLLHLAASANVAVWVNVKEIGFSDEVLALHPEVIKDGVFCPSEPFWQEYIAAKTGELFSDFPGLAGMIVSFGSQESRASRVQNRCHCVLCTREPLADWYGRMIQTLHAQVAGHGKRLAVRDFAYKPQDHAPLVQAMRAAPPDVVFCIKAMPHDFYLTFPNNPAIGTLARTQWVEYDVMGQFYGWGVMPCTVVDDLSRRMEHWRACQVDGAIFRIEWERINDLDVLDTLNEINLIAAAELARGVPTDTVQATQAWLVAHGHASTQAALLASVLEQTWPIIRAAAYMNGHVSADNSMLPRSISRAWWGMESRDSLAVWAPERAGDLRLDAALADAYLREKDAALDATRTLQATLQQLCGTLEPAVASTVQKSFAHFSLWIEGLVLCTKVCIWCRLLEQDGRHPNENYVALRQLLDQLRAYMTRAAALARDPQVPHQVVMLTDAKRASDILLDAQALLERAGADGPLAANTRTP